VEFLKERAEQENWLLYFNAEFYHDSY